MSGKKHTSNGIASNGRRRKNGGQGPMLNHEYELEPGDPMYVDPDEDSVLKPRRGFGIGFTARDLRVREWKYHKRKQLRREHRNWSAAQIEKAADEAFEEHRRQSYGAEEMRFFEETAPVSRSRRPSDTKADVEVAAMRWLGIIRWLILVLRARTIRRGFTGKKCLVLAIFLQMAFGRERPEFAGTYATFMESRPLRAWAHDYPDTSLKRPSAYQSFDKMLVRQAEPGVVVAVCVEAIKRLADLHNPFEGPRKRKRKKGEPLLVGEIGIVDGTMIPAHVQQRFVGDDEELKQMLHGPGREMVAHVVHRDTDGTVHKENTGYIQVALGDMASTTLYGVVIEPGNGNERKGLMRLLKMIFEVWPDCPMSAIVGDGLFHNDKQLAHELVFNYGIQPIFPSGEKSFRKDLPHAETAGVPHCACGEMEQKDHELYTAERRAKEGIPRGAPAPKLNGRIKWKCPNGKCKGVATRPFDEPRLYTLYPRQGSSPRAIERRVLMLRRNAIESIFASLKNLALGNDKFNCPPWAKGRGMEWLLGAGALALTARRVVHDSGLYERALSEADSLGLLESASRQSPAPGPDPATLNRVFRKREAWLEIHEPVLAPRGYEGLLSRSCSPPANVPLAPSPCLPAAA